MPQLSTSGPIGAWKWKLLSNCDRPNNQPTGSPTDQRFWGIIGKLHSQWDCVFRLAETKRRWILIHLNWEKYKLFRKVSFFCISLENGNFYPLIFIRSLYRTSLDQLWGGTKTLYIRPTNKKEKKEQEANMCQTPGQEEA